QLARRRPLYRARRRAVPRAHAARDRPVHRRAGRARGVRREPARDPGHRRAGDGPRRAGPHVSVDRRARAHRRSTLRAGRGPGICGRRCALMAAPELIVPDLEINRRLTVLPLQEYYTSGHRTCQGCESALVMRYMAKVAGPRTLVTGTTG